MKIELNEEESKKLMNLMKVKIRGVEWVLDNKNPSKPENLRVNLGCYNSILAKLEGSNETSNEKGTETPIEKEKPSETPKNDSKEEKEVDEDE